MNKQIFPLCIYLMILGLACQLVSAGTLSSGKYYTWGIDGDTLAIPEGSIITDCTLTIHNVSGWNDDMFVHLLDNPLFGFASGDDGGVAGDYFAGSGVLLNMTYADPDLVCQFSNYDDPSS